MAASLAGKVCLITGASSGIGAATAVAFAKLGASLALTGRNLEALQSTVSNCKEMGSSTDVHTIVADLAKESDRQRIVAETIKRFNRLDVLVNNAGIWSASTVDSPNLMSVYDAMMEVNTKAPLHLIHLAVPHLTVSKGNIVNVSSVNGLRAFPGLLAYNISKAALDHLTTSAALELAPKGIRVNSINPGVTVTDLQRRGGVNEEGLQKLYERTKETHPLSAHTGIPCKPEEIADAIAFMATDSSRYVTGAHLPVDGGRHATCLR